MTEHVIEEQAETAPEDVISAASQAAATEEADDCVARVKGQPITAMPEGLYIPPDALEVILDTFQGPLDLLLYLIKRQNLDIVDIPVAEITKQYIEYIELMEHMRFELAAEYLVMAAMLAEIKSRLLLPRSTEEEGAEDDPRAELVRRLLEYERFKSAAENLQEMPRVGEDIFLTDAELPDLKVERPLPDVSLKDLLFAFKDVMQRADMSVHHQVKKESLSIRERMTDVLSRVKSESFTDFKSLFTVQEGRMGVVVTFIAVLELLRQSLIEIVQSQDFAPIYVKASCSEAEPQEINVSEEYV